MSHSDQQPEQPDDILDGGAVQNLAAPDVRSEPEQATVNAGVVRGLGERDLAIRTANRIRLQHSWTAIVLAFAFIAILAASTWWHYHTVLLLYSQDKADVAQQLSSIFDKWFPVMTGFTGSAVTYFLTKERA
ncbi:hypothetical protein V3W47_01800 [Deinococcus sp. YIM 134068]|uniref:hypothetical protein n=1 Tax=Deinococcus lichenicola TaxID=3118910 RepID=UPI002F941856